MAQVAIKLGCAQRNVLLRSVDFFMLETRFNCIFV